MKIQARYLLLARAIVLASSPSGFSASWHEGAPPFAGELRNLTLRGELHPAPEYHFRDRTGAAISLVDFRGRLVLLNFWATWCPPCVEEMPALDRLQARFGGARFEVVALSVNRRGLEAIMPFFAEHDLSALRPYSDPSMASMSAFNLPALPTSLIIGPQGDIIATMAGPADWDSPDAHALIAYLIENAPFP